MKETIIQLPTAHYKHPQRATTSGRHWYGPGTILEIEHDDGGIDQIEFDYDPNATVADLRKKLRGVA